MTLMAVGVIVDLADTPVLGSWVDGVCAVRMHYKGYL